MRACARRKICRHAGSRMILGRALLGVGGRGACEQQPASKTTQHRQTDNCDANVIVSLAPRYTTSQKHTLNRLHCDARRYARTTPRAHQQQRYGGNNALTSPHSSCCFEAIHKNTRISQCTLKNTCPLFNLCSRLLNLSVRKS